jgi:hypothetical protein
VSRLLPVVVCASLAGLPPCALAGHEDDGPQANKNHVVSLGWGGCVDTDLNFGEFFANDHTLVMRFMPQFVYSYAAPLFGENGTGNFIVGIGDYNWRSAAGRRSAGQSCENSGAVT